MTQEVGLLVLVDALVLGLLYLTVFQNDTPTQHIRAFASQLTTLRLAQAHTVACNTKP